MALSIPATATLLSPKNNIIFLVVEQIHCHHPSPRLPPLTNHTGFPPPAALMRDIFGEPDNQFSRLNRATILLDSASSTVTILPRPFWSIDITGLVFLLAVPNKFIFGFFVTADRAESCQYGVDYINCPHLFPSDSSPALRSFGATGGSTKRHIIIVSPPWSSTGRVVVPLLGGVFVFAGSTFSSFGAVEFNPDLPPPSISTP